MDGEVAKWRNRTVTTDAPMGPTRRNTVLTPAEEAIVVEFRKRTLLPLDDVLGCLRDTRALHDRAALAKLSRPLILPHFLRRTGIHFVGKCSIPHLSRPALHRCLQRHSISRLPAAETAQTRKRFKTYEMGYAHIDSCELRHAQGELAMFLAIDRVSRFADVEFYESAGKMKGTAFLRNVVPTFPIRSARF